MKGGFDFLQRNLPGIFWTALIVLLMGIPGNRFPEIKSFWDWLEPDKSIHVFLFGVWAFLFLRQNAPQYQLKSKRLYIVVFFAGILLTSFTELMQEYVFINRSGSFYDALANMSGMVFGSLIHAALHRKKS